MHITPVEKRGGFETWAGYDNNNSQYDSWVHGGTGKDAFHYRLPGYETDELTNLLIRYIKEQADALKSGTGKPFFAALSVQPPHNPYVAPEDWMGRHNPAQLQLRPNVPERALDRGPGAARTGRLLRHDREPGLEHRPHPQGAGPRRGWPSTPTSCSSATTATCTAPTASSSR